MHKLSFGLKYVNLKLEHLTGRRFVWMTFIGISWISEISKDDPSLVTLSNYSFWNLLPPSQWGFGLAFGIF